MISCSGHCWVLLLHGISVSLQTGLQSSLMMALEAGFVHDAGCRSDDQDLGSVTEQGQSLDQQHRKVL